jgi:Cys-rich protein (TIGR01571 family)
MWLAFALLLGLDGSLAAALPIQQRARLGPALVETAKATGSAPAEPAAQPAAQPAARAAALAQRSALPPADPADNVAALQTANSMTSRTRAVVSKVYQRVVQPVQDGLQQYSATQLLVSHVIILTALGFIWAFACMGNQRSTMLVSRDDLSGDFKPIGLCSCISMRAMNVAETCCCSIFMWAETAAKLGVGSFGLLLAGVVTLQVLDNALITVGGPAAYLGYLGGIIYLGLRLWARHMMRKDLKQQTNNTAADALYDFFSHLCCTPCAIAQEAEFVEHYEKHYPLQAV